VFKRRINDLFIINWTSFISTLALLNQSSEITPIFKANHTSHCFNCFRNACFSRWIFTLFSFPVAFADVFVVRCSFLYTSVCSTCCVEIVRLYMYWPCQIDIWHQQGFNNNNFVGLCIICIKHIKSGEIFVSDFVHRTTRDSRLGACFALYTCSRHGTTNFERSSRKFA